MAFVLIGMLGCIAMPSVDAQIMNYADSGEPEDPGLSLIQDEPHDIIYFTEESGGGWAKVILLDFPGRKPPSKPSGTLKFQVLGIETKQFMAKWDDIKRIDLWEIRLERETKERLAKGDFVGAYPFLSVLMRDYPDKPNIAELRSDFLLRDAIARVKRKEYAETLAMLEELRRFDRNYKSSQVIRALSGTADRLMQQYVDEGKLSTAQQILSRLEVDYKRERLDAVTKWNQTFLKMATEKQQQAIAALEAKNYRLARSAALESVAIKPEIAGGKELVTRIQKIYPLVNVGVLQSAEVFEPTRIDNWAARRVGRLLYRTLFEIRGAGPEGGEYDFIFGETEMSPDRMHFDLFIQPDSLVPPMDKVSGFGLADRMAARAMPSMPQYFAPWASAVESVGLVGPQQVTFNLRRPNVMPICLLQIPVDGSWFGGQVGSPTGDYRRDTDATGEENVSRYVLSGQPRGPSQPREIVETRVASGTEGVNMLLQGKIDVIDQLFPADAVRLQKKRNIKVATYPLPTVHMLVPCSEHPYLAEGAFRRALVYGTNREDILRGELLEGLDSEGCRVLSGPFPAGIELNDPLGYAYDQSRSPRPYEPPLAKLLLAMNENQMKAAAERKKEKPPEMTPIRLAFPADNLSRVACEAISTQWRLLGLEVQLVELPIGRTFPNPDEDIADLVYVSAAVWEPVIDARRILGPEGLAGSTNQLVGLGLRRIEEAKNWRQVRDGLVDLHSISFTELPVLPLWQMVDSYAYRRELIGVGSDIVSLYQNADKWRLSE